MKEFVVFETKEKREHFPANKQIFSRFIAKKQLINKN